MFRIYLVNFLLAISTTVGMTFIPFMITDSLGLSLLVLGILEGVTEFLSNVFRLGNGMLFDKIKNKRNVFVASTSMAFGAKALLFIPNPWIVLISKTLERIANGTFASPRDAYVAGNAKQKGMALGLLNVSKTLGCVLGPLIVSVSTLFIGPLRENIGFFVSLCCLIVAPAFFISFSLNVKHFQEQQFSLKELKKVLKNISPILILTLLFFLGRFNDGLLMMYMKHHEFPEWFYLSTIAIFNSVMLITSPVIGRQIDKGLLKNVCYITISALVVFNVCFFQLGVFGWSAAIIGLFTWGIQRAGAQIVFSALVFKSVNKAYYGTAIGVYYIVSGFATMFSSFFCGYLASHDQFSSVFLFSGFFAFIALALAATLLNTRLFEFVPKYATTSQ